METYNGHVRTPQDAILLFEACRIGLLPRVQRRLSEKERQQIKSGSVFVWDEREAGMRRWTDGKSWSASRVSGSFLTYREMEGKRGGNSFPAPTPQPKRASAKSPDGSNTGDSDGEGPDGYRYKPDGLMKQSFSITTSSGQHLHLISYFSRSHPTNLQQPSQDANLRHIRPPKSMYPETTVNETTNVPAVTRGPMPGSPYAPAPHQVGSGSPYSRPGTSQQVHNYVNWPPTPGGTPPYHYAYFPTQAPPGHSPLPYAQVIYAPGPQMYAHPHPAPGATVYDRAPPHLSNSGMPLPPVQHHHPPMMPAQAGPPQYIPNPPARAMQATDLVQQQAQLNAHQNGHPHAPPPSSTLPEQGPQLPAINGATPATGRVEKPPTPQPNEPISQDSLAVPESNGTSATNAPSPARTIPSLGSLLNNHDANNGATSKSNQSNSRSGSRSPSSSQRPTREIPGDRLASNSNTADSKALQALNSRMLIR